MGDFKISVILEKAISNHYRFLKRIYHNKQLHKPHVITNAIRRYETCWLPLLAKCGEDVTLVPPDDIWWIWHVHMLSTKQYQRDCLHVTGEEYQHHDLHLLSPGQLAAATTKTNEIWIREYPKELYDVNMDEIDMEIIYKSRCAYDLRAASRRQRHFFYHVSLPHYKSGPFLNDAIDRYTLFIKLKKLYPHQILVPMYDIDLIWHSHQLCTEAYQRDTIGYLGQILHHDDSINNRQISSVRTKAEAKTKQLWYKHYKTPLCAPGTMYRGSPPEGALYDFNLEMYDISAVKGGLLRIDSIDMKLPDKSSGSYECTISVVNDRGFQVDLILDDTKLGKAFKVEKGHFLWDQDTDYKGKLPLTVRVVLKQKYWLTITVIKKSGLKGKKEFQKCRLDIEDDILTNYEDMREKKGSEQELSIKYQSKGATFIVLCTLSKFNKLDQEFRMERESSFTTEEIPKNPEDLWGPVPLHHISHEKLQKFPNVRVANYRIIGNNSMKDSSDLTCKVIHSLPLRMSAIYVMQNSKVAAISHIIGLDQLPKLDTTSDLSFYKRPQSDYDHITLDTRKGQRAMIIKNNQGDWGILLGCWVDTRKAAVKSKENGSAASPGHLQVLFYDLTHDPKSCKSAAFYDDNGKNNKLDMGTMKLDVTDNGTFAIRGQCEQPAENIALALSAISLFVLCEPRNKVTVNCLKHQGYKNEEYHETVGQKSDLSHYALGHAPWLVMMFLCLGYDEETPSNSHLYLASQEDHDDTHVNEERNEAEDHVNNAETEAREHQDERDDVKVEEATHGDIDEDFYNPYSPAALSDGEAGCCPWEFPGGDDTTDGVNGHDDLGTINEEDEGTDGASCATGGGDCGAD